jgi:hypothetical protein
VNIGNFLVVVFNNCAVTLQMKRQEKMITMNPRTGIIPEIIGDCGYDGLPRSGKSTIPGESLQIHTNVKKSATDQENVGTQLSGADIETQPGLDSAHGVELNVYECMFSGSPSQVCKRPPY